MKKVTAWRLYDCMQDRERERVATPKRSIGLWIDTVREGGREKVNLALSKASPGADITA
jgi:hypothetical protein